MKNTKRLALSAVLLSLALALSYLERLMPLQLILPLPGFKLGLANIVTLVALFHMGAKSAFLIVFLRCLLASVFGGGITAFLFSVTGGMLSVCIMAASAKAPVFSVYGVSILGAAAHNTGQILAASVLMNTVRIFGYLPYLLAISVITGLLTATAASGVLKILMISAPGGKIKPSNS